MSKQEQIKEGIEHVITVNHPYIASEIADKVIEYLDSQGVVIKGDRELPAYTPRDESNNLVRLGFGMARRDMLEAGYGAFESIIPSNQH